MLIHELWDLADAAGWQHTSAKTGTCQFYRIGRPGLQFEVTLQQPGKHLDTDWKAVDLVGSLYFRGTFYPLSLELDRYIREALSS